MNCLEFERVLLEGEHTPEQQAHLDSCSACADLQADLDLISSQAKLLLAADEPSPAVWNLLESRLRSEGLIRRPERAQPRFDFFRRWRAAWLVPVAAALAIVAGLRLHHATSAGDNHPVAKELPATVPAGASVSIDDQQLLSRVSSRPPAQRARYNVELNNANAFIRDAEAAAKSDPNDVFRQQMLINAYEQKQMLYDLAVDRNGEQ